LLVVAAELNREDVMRRSTVQAPPEICYPFEKCPHTIFEAMNVLPTEQMFLEEI
jgi:hypothetical protein